LIKPIMGNGHATLFSSLPEENLLQTLEKSLNISKFALDTSGDYEEDVYISSFLGFEVTLAKDKGTSDRYHLAVFTSRNTFDYYEINGIDLNWNDTLIAMLQPANLDVRERRCEDESD